MAKKIAKTGTPVSLVDLFAKAAEEAFEECIVALNEWHQHSLRFPELDRRAAMIGLTREPDEDDESLRRRILEAINMKPDMSP